MPHRRDFQGGRVAGRILTGRRTPCDFSRVRILNLLVLTMSTAGSYCFGTSVLSGASRRTGTSGVGVLFG